MKLQANLSRVIKGIGDLDFNRWRAFSTPERVSDEPFRFVDGDFIERFLELPEDAAEAVVTGAGKEIDALGVDVDEVRGIVETLKRLL
jgi:DNA damage-binding protein 1